MIALLQEDPLAFLLAFSALVMSLVLHEVGHAYAAHLFGDDTAKRQGRLSLNPLRHLDPLGTLLLLLVGFGWARPVPIYPPAFRAYRLGLFAVSVAGILVNLALAVLFALAVRGLFALDPEGVYGAFRGSGGSALGLLALAAYVASSINLVLVPPKAPTSPPASPYPPWTAPRSSKAFSLWPGTLGFGGWSSTPGFPSSSSSRSSGGPSRRSWPSPARSSSPSFWAKCPHVGFAA